MRYHQGPAATLAAAAGMALGACRSAPPAPLFEKAPVERRDVVVTAVAQGVIQPRLTFSVKSKAWGEILTLPVQTGYQVSRGELLATIDPRLPQATLTEATAGLARAQAQLTNARATLTRSTALYATKAIPEVDFDVSKLAFATAQAAVASAEANLETARDAMEDTRVRAPIDGTILELDAGLGAVISSPTLGGGTVILKMANLDTVQDSAMVAETDIANVQPGLPVTIAVDAYPGRAFGGTVRKIGPQAQVVQNITMFPVFVDLPNPEHLLRAGMNSDVTIHTGRSQQALAIPYAALRTAQDAVSAASVLGLDPAAVARQVAAATAAGPPRAPRERAPGAPAESLHAGTFTMPSGGTITLPPGVTAAQVSSAFVKMRSGAAPTPAERALLTRVLGRSPRLGGPRGRNPRTSYLVFALRGGTPVPVPIATGLSDQDYIEVTSGLNDGDTVLILPSASLVQSQQQFRQRFQSVTGGGLPGLRQQGQQPQPSQPGRP